jgi:Zn-finger nucleic acid-binding protein
MDAVIFQNARAGVSAMDCPACKHPMMILELDQIETDYCPCCSGIWFDAGELELLLGSHQQVKALFALFHIEPRSGEKLRKCPICHKKMRKIHAGSTDVAPLVDSCRYGHGLWFDKGELQSVLSTAHLDEEGKIRTFLMNMFGAKHVIS